MYALLIIQLNSSTDHLLNDQLSAQLIIEMNAYLAALIDGYMTT